MLELLKHFKTQSEFATANENTKRWDGLQQAAKWSIHGFPHLRAALFIAPRGSRNAGEAYADVRRVTPEGKTLKLLRVKADSIGAVLGFTTIWDRCARDAATPDAERRLYAELASRVAAVIVDVIDPRAARPQQNVTEVSSPEPVRANGSTTPDTTLAFD